MAKDFAFTFYVTDWLGGTIHLSIEEKGAYFELLLMQFNRGPFTITHVKHVLNTAFERCWPAVQDKFETDGTLYWNKRMKDVQMERAKYVESRRNNRLGKAKPTTHEEHVSNIPQTHVKHVEDEDEDENVINNKEATSLEKTFADYIAMRKKIRKPPTPRAIELVQQKLVKLAGNDEQLAIAILNQSIVACWTDIYPLKQQTNEQPINNHKQKQSDNLLELANRAKNAQTAIANSNQ